MFNEIVHRRTCACVDALLCVCVCTYSILMYSAAACLAERHILCCLATCNILPTDLLSEKQTACSLILLTSHICHFTSKTHWMPCCVSLFEIYLSLCEHLNFLFSPFFSLDCQISYCFSLDKVEINIRIF